MNGNIRQYASYNLSLSGWPQWWAAAVFDWDIEFGKRKFCINSPAMRNITYYSIRHVIVWRVCRLKSTAADQISWSPFLQGFMVALWSFSKSSGMQVVRFWNCSLGNEMNLLLILQTVGTFSFLFTYFFKSFSTSLCVFSRISFSSFPSLGVGPRPFPAMPRLTPPCCTFGRVLPCQQPTQDIICLLIGFLQSAFVVEARFLPQWVEGEATVTSLPDQGFLFGGHHPHSRNR